MKLLAYKIIKYIIVIILIVWAIVGCCNILYKWNTVPSYRHIVYLYHPMSEEKSDSHYVSADVQIMADDVPEINELEKSFVSNGNDVCIFRIFDREKSSDVVEPFYNRCDDLYRVYFDESIGSSLQNKLNKEIGLNKVSNVFVLLHYSMGNVIKQETPRIGFLDEKKHSIMVSKKDSVINSYWELENMINEIHRTCHEREIKDSFDDRLFDFPVDSLFLASYYVFVDEESDSVCLNMEKENEPVFLKLWDILMTDHDITKGEYHLMVLSESIDSLNFTMRFTDVMRFFPISFPKVTDLNVVKGSNYITIKGIHNHENYDGSNRLFALMKDGKLSYTAGGIYNNGRYNEISFFAERLGTKVIQWIRVFVVTSILASFIALLFRYIYKFGKVIFREKNGD